MSPIANTNKSTAYRCDRCNQIFINREAAIEHEKYHYVDRNKLFF